MSETAQIIFAVCIGICFLAATFVLVILAIDVVKGWKK